MKRYDPAAERERLEKSIHDLTNRMLEIGFMLDDDSISDSEFSRLEKEEIEVIAKIGKYQTRFDFLNVRMISNVSDWTAEFLESFETGTRKISNRQGETFRKINNGKPFIYKGRRYDCRGANYRAGFGALIVTDLESTEIETETTETETTETVSNRRQYVATFMDGLDGAIRVEFLEATDEKHARYKAQHMAGMFETVKNVREVDPDDFEEISGVTVPRFVDVMTHDEISGTIDALKKAVALLENEMGADNIPKEEWLELDKEVTGTWEEIGVLQYLQIIQGTGVDPSNRKFRDVEMGEIVTIDDVLHTWAAYKEIHEEHPHFPQYLGNCQTYQGGTLEEIR